MLELELKLYRMAQTYTSKNSNPYSKDPIKRYPLLFQNPESRHCKGPSVEPLPGLPRFQPAKRQSCVPIGVIVKLYWGYMGIMEKKMEPTILK